MRVICEDVFIKASWLEPADLSNSKLDSDRTLLLLEQGKTDKKKTFEVLRLVIKPVGRHSSDG